VLGSSYKSTAAGVYRFALMAFVPFFFGSIR